MPQPPPPARFKALQVQTCTERCSCLLVNYDADICYAVFAFISKKRGGGLGCEYPGPFVVTNCGTLGAREERGRGSKNVQSCKCFTYKVETSFI